MPYVFQTKDNSGKSHVKWRFQYRDYQGVKRTGTGNTSKKDTMAMAVSIETEHKLIKKGYKELPDKYQRHNKRDFMDAVNEYISWGKAQGGRSGRPWSQTHSIKREYQLIWWNKHLSIKTLGAMQNILTEVEKKIREMQKEGKSGKTITNYIDSLHSFLSYCLDRDYLKEHPLKKLKTPDDSPLQIRRSMNHDEIQRLLESIDKEEYLLLVQVALISGLRLNELRQLSSKDLDLNRKGLVLHAKWTKNRKDGFQPLPSALIGLLNKFAEKEAALSLYQTYGTPKESYPSSPLLFVPKHGSRMLDTYLEKADIEKVNHEGKIDFHSFRVTYINLIIDTGATAKSAQALARHASVNMTFNTYGRTNNDSLRKSVEQVSSIILAERKNPLVANCCEQEGYDMEVGGVEPPS